MIRDRVAWLLIEKGGGFNHGYSGRGCLRGQTLRVMA
jgi:hypothetical protein